jgi:hypothetical protein
VKNEVYGDLKKSPAVIEYTFRSVGANGVIPIGVRFTESDDPGIFDLVFGLILDNGILNDVIRLNNGDSDKILATVVAAIVRFTSEYPEKVIWFSGSTPARTRLYRMIISLNLDELSKDFEIFGKTDHSDTCWENFEKERPYVDFTIKRKTKN